MSAVSMRERARRKANRLIADYIRADDAADGIAPSVTERRIEALENNTVGVSLYLRELRDAIAASLYRHRSRRWR